ncbi:MAG: leucine-rich repeat protein [Clostridia bacterium]|nr:leucine-rich repeat protein [Clostridia bacterium]
MGETKDSHLHLGFSIARIVTAALVGIFFVAAMAQIVFFQQIKISFQSGTDAQQFDTITMKKGTKVDLPMPLKPGSYFLGWSLSPTDTKILPDSTSLMRDTTLYAVWDGAEKYASLSVNGMAFREVNIFDTRIDGLTADELTYGKRDDHSDSWRVLDDYAFDNPNLKDYDGIKADPNNNFSRFLGWRYLNAYNTYNDLLFTADADGKGGIWTWVKRNADNEEESLVIDDEHRFYPPNYRTTFKALLDYRIANIKFFDHNLNNERDSITVQLGASDVTLKDFSIFRDNQDAHFSYWKLNEGSFKNLYANVAENPELANLLANLKTRYAAGESFDALDPLLYYFGRNLMSPDGKSDLQVSLKFDAVYWDDTNEQESQHQFTMQSFTDQSSGTEYHDFKGTNFEHLSPETPVGYDADNDLIWLYDGNEISSYAFYDHKGVYHEINTDKISGAQAIPLGLSFPLLGEEIYFNNKWGINVMVNYASSTIGIDVIFNYGSDLYLLPNYNFFNTEVKFTLYNRHIGDNFEILTGEKYMKENYIFTGWRMVGDKSNRLYSAGENFTIPNFNASQQSQIEFVADWHLQRLLFNFDFNGGGWATEAGPDFTMMKGAYGNRVRVVGEEPVKLGYDFVGWTLEDDNQKYFQPNDDILINEKFQTLHAHWQPMRLRITLKFKRDAQGGWGTFGTPIFAYTGDEIVLTPAQSNDFYTFNDWQITSNILTADVLAALETSISIDEQGKILNVIIYADQDPRTVPINYFNNQSRILAQNGDDITDKIDISRLVTALPQGTLFYDYYPFSLMRTEGSYAGLDTNGRPFLQWVYTKDGRNFVKIDADTIVPTVGKNQSLTIEGQLGSPKTVSVEFYDYCGNPVDNPVDIDRSFNITEFFDLPHAADNSVGIEAAKCVNVESYIDGWGTFVGWSPEPDQKAGNPALIFDVFDYANTHNTVPRLRFDTRNDTASAPYLIDIDNHQYVYLDTRSKNQGLVPDADYVLRLYAIYSNNYAMVTYATLHDHENDNTALKLPVYSNRDYDHTKIGGRTVGGDSSDFVSYGNTVLDDANLSMWGGRSFVGWVATLPDGVSDEVRAQFENKIWFPGEILPAIDFDITFNPIRVYQDNQVREYVICQCGEAVEVQAGTHPEYCETCGKKLFNRTYHILALSDADSRIKYTGSIDIVVLPRGDYTVEQGGITITSDREVHVVVPSAGAITLQPRAIQCNTIKEFYVGDNLNITGSPVIGPQFAAYHVKKGYRVIDKNDNSTPTAILDSSTKYDFAASMSDGLLVSADGTTLLGVPCHSSITTAKLNQLINYSITHIANYALSDINNLTTINLTKNANLTVDANALYGVNAQNIILPATNNDSDNIIVDPQVLSGSLRNLEKVTFGDDHTVTTGYAFVDNNMVYYIDNNENAKKHLIYVLKNVECENLRYVGNCLTVPQTVAIIEPQALSGLDWNRVKAVRAENTAVDLRGLAKVIPDTIPLFTDINNIGFQSGNNWYQNTSIQSYYKTFKFVFNGETVIKSYAYGQTFRVFSAQKYKDEDGREAVMFDKAWHHFVAWRCNNRPLSVGTVYRVGIDSEIVGTDKNITEFNATSSACWVPYPVQLITYNSYQPEGGFTFKDLDDNVYALSDLIGKNLNNIYLPALNQKIVRGTDEYQFIGWSKSAGAADNFNLWNSVGVDDRILPNKTARTTLNSGNNNDNVYYYYALYEKVTPNLKYTLENDGTYSVNGLENYNIASLNIPFAKYNTEIKNGVKDNNYGYMTPITKIGDDAFGQLAQTLNSLEIGGAVSMIGEGAFSGVRVATITFQHKGDNIVYNKGQGTPRFLTIGEFAFANSTLETLLLPLSTETIATSAFESCSALHTVNFAGDYKSAALQYLGDQVFKGDSLMTNNKIVSLLEEDVRKSRFKLVGSGIFQDTAVKSTDTARDRIVWGDTLLHIYFKDNSSSQHVIIPEKIIAGYAFANLGAYDANGNLITIKIEFTNANLQVKTNAFASLPNSVNEIIMNRAGISANNVDIRAFAGISNQHPRITVRVLRRDDWKRIEDNVDKTVITFTSMSN